MSAVGPSENRSGHNRTTMTINTRGRAMKETTVESLGPWLPSECAHGRTPATCRKCWQLAYAQKRATNGGFAMPTPDRCPECAHPEVEHVTYSKHESHPLAGLIVCAAQMRGGCQCRRPAETRSHSGTR